MKESEMVSDFVKGLNSQPGWHAFKISNYAPGQTQVCDVIGSWKGRAFAFEAKLARVTSWDQAYKGKMLSENSFRLGQLPSLRRMQSKGQWHVYILAGVHNTVARKTRVFLMLFSIFEEDPSRVWTMARLEEFCPELTRLANVGWLPPDSLANL